MDADLTLWGDMNHLFEDGKGSLCPVKTEDTMREQKKRR